ncbi:hypothetical protein C2S52_013966, partial [Perilla frutescens var. hirtella]
MNYCDGEQVFLTDSSSFTSLQSAKRIWYSFLDYCDKEQVIDDDVHSVPTTEDENELFEEETTDGKL